MVILKFDLHINLHLQNFVPLDFSYSPIHENVYTQKSILDLSVKCVPANVSTNKVKLYMKPSLIQLIITTCKVLRRRLKSKIKMK